MFAYGIVVVTLALSSASDGLDQGTARLLTGVVATAIDGTEGVDVLTNEDVKRSLEAEASRQTLGCSTSSCLAELAGAMGAQYAVYGDVGRLGQSYAVTLNVFDSAKAAATGRSVITAATVEELAQKTDATAQQLAQAIPRGSRVLVFDLSLQSSTAAADAAPPPEDDGISPFVFAGAGALGLGAAALAFGVFADVTSVTLDAQADDPAVAAGKADELYDSSDGWMIGALVGYGLGAVGVIAGGALLALVVLE